MKYQPWANFCTYFSVALRSLIHKAQLRSYAYDVSFGNFLFWNTVEGPHSQCSLMKIPNYLQNFRLQNMQNFWLQNNIQKRHFQVIFSFHVCLCNLGLALKSKNWNFITLNWVYFIRENFQNLCQMRKWALWIGLLVPIIPNVRWCSCLDLVS